MTPDLEAIRARNEWRALHPPSVDDQNLIREHVSRYCQDRADIDTLLTEVEVSDGHGQPTACTFCGSVFTGKHTMRACRDACALGADDLNGKLRTQTVAHGVWRERAGKRCEERDAALAEVDRLQAESIAGVRAVKTLLDEKYGLTPPDSEPILPLQGDSRE